MALDVGSTIAPYSVTAKIGEGDMGEVYRARDTAAPSEPRLGRACRKPSRKTLIDLRGAGAIRALIHYRVCSSFGYGSRHRAAFVLEQVSHVWSNRRPNAAGFGERTNLL